MKNPLLTNMLQSYSCQNEQDAVNALREIMQNIVLLALSRSNFFNHAAFYGGTALRILYGLKRGSEDMDFSLLTPDNEFDITDYADAIITEFASFGLSATFAGKVKMAKTNIQSAFLKSNTHTQLLAVGLDRNLFPNLNTQSEMKIKVEVDIEPPDGFATEIKYVYSPLPFAVKTLTLPDLLAGKIHAVLFRGWKNRVKGRDWYDLTWYAGNHPAYNLQHLENRARQSGDYKDSSPLTGKKVQQLLLQRLALVDMENLKADVKPFIRDQRELEIWNSDFFTALFQQLHPLTSANRS